MSKLTNLFDPRMALFDFVKFTGALPVIIGQRMKKVYINGKKPKGIYRGKFIVSCNHSTMRDPLTLYNALWMRRIRFFATKEILELKFWGRFFKWCGCIRVDRENFSFETIQEAKKTLDRGHVLGIFPEGHVDESTELNEFKSGVVMMALMNRAEVLPLYICKRINKWKRQVVIVGERIKLESSSSIPTRTEVEEMTTLLYNKEKELKEIAKRYE